MMLTRKSESTIVAMPANSRGTGPCPGFQCYLEGAAAGSTNHAWVQVPIGICPWGQRIVGFDNERGKGDHMHRGDEEFPYEFRGVEPLLKDFVAEVTKWRG